MSSVHKVTCITQKRKKKSEHKCPATHDNLWFTVRVNKLETLKQIVLTHEQIVGFWTFATNFKQLFKIVKLSLNVAADLRRRKEVQCSIRKG